MGRTIREISVLADETKVKAYVSKWLENSGFEILEKESVGGIIEKSSKPFRVRLTTHPGSTVALRASRLGMIVFEIKVERSDQGCLIHGEFYVAGASGGLLDWSGRESDVCEKPDIVGRLPRKKGYRLMNDFVSEMQSAFPKSPR